MHFLKSSRRSIAGAAPIVLACGIVSFGATWTAIPRPTTHPFRLTDGLLIAVRVTADSTITEEFLVDTAAGIHVASAGFLDRLKARPAGRYSGFRHTGERVDFEMFRISSLAVGPIVQAGPVLGRWPALDGFGIAGILSAKFFERQPVTFDFPSRRLIFESPRTLDRRARAGASVPLGIARDRDKSVELFADFVIGNAGRSVEAECKLDTGLDGYVFDSRLMPLLRISKAAPSVEQRETTSHFGARETQFRTTITRISLRGRPRVTAADVTAVFKDHLTTDCLVGTGFWLGRILTIDIENARLIVP